MTPHIAITPQAAEHLRDELGGKLLRIAFTTGCGGSGYRLGSAEEAADEDVVLEVDSIRVALDAMAARRLDGAVIDYQGGEDGYVLNHPDAATATWCG